MNEGFCIFYQVCFYSQFINEGAWRDLTYQTLSPVPLFCIKNEIQLMVTGGFYNYSPYIWREFHTKLACSGVQL